MVLDASPSALSVAVETAQTSVDQSWWFSRVCDESRGRETDSKIME